METKLLKSALVLAFASSLLLLTACDRPVKFSQNNFSSKTENPVPPEIPETPELPVEAKSLVINNQDTYTSASSVSLILDATNVNGMYITESADCSSGGQWEAFNKSKAWTLKTLNQSATVYAKFRSGDYETSCVSDDIIHDDQAPVISLTSTPPASSQETSAHYKFSVTDSGSGIASVTCALDASTPVSCDQVMDYVNLTNGVHQFKVVASDKAGNQSQASHQFEVVQNIHNQVITIGSSTGKADILFVVNNSESMWSELRGPVSAKFKSFVSALNATDYKIAVTTGDTRGIKPYEAGGFSYIMRTAAPGAGIALVPKTRELTPSVKNAEKLLQVTLMRPEAICIQVETGMCPNPASSYQEGVHASLLALSRNENQAFFRNDASLHVVIISDDDEGAGNLTDRQGNILASTPIYNRPDTLIKTVQSRWPDKEFKAHAVIRKKGARCNGFETEAKEAHIYQKLVEQTGGQFADFCDEYDTKDVAKIASAITTQAPVYTLTCDPVDANKDGKVDASDLLISYSPVANPAPKVTLQGRKINFDPLPKPGTEVRLSYICPL